MNEPLAEMLRQNTWANLGLLDACAGLTPDQLDATVPGTRGTIRETLLHIVGGEARYCSILTGHLPEPTLNERSPWEGVEPLRAAARAAGEVLIAYAAGLDEDREIHVVTPPGREFHGFATVILVQTMNHGTEHRSQVKVVLSQLGIEPPELDGWNYATATGKVEPPER